MVEHINHPENLDPDLEYDDGYNEPWDEDYVRITELVAGEKLILCGESDGDRAFEGVSYVWVDPNYGGRLSLGQRKLYEMLVMLQRAAVHSMTTIGRLTEAQGLKNPHACAKRLENLQSLGAIHGLKYK